jgi:hypothetical protein
VLVLVVSVSLLLETVADVGLPVEVVRVLLVAVLVNETEDVRVLLLTDVDVADEVVTLEVVYDRLERVLLDTVMLIGVLVNVPVLLVNVVELPDEDV